MKVKIELESIQWSWVLNAISDCERQARQDAENWEDDYRQQQFYKMEESFFSFLYKRIKEQLDCKLIVEINRELEEKE